MMQPTPVRRNHVIDRRDFIGGSDARIIMGQNVKALIRLWQEKRGEVGPEDLTGDLIVQLGLATEDLNRAWYERITRKGPASHDNTRRLFPDNLPTLLALSLHVMYCR